VNRSPWLLIAVVPFVVACSSSAPEPSTGIDGKPDPVLTLGREVWLQNCASCHGDDGGGTSRGVKLNDGQIIEAFPNSADQTQLILNGTGRMPSFSGDLNESELEAVVRYIRELLA